MGILVGADESTMQTIPAPPDPHKKEVYLELALIMVESQVIEDGVTCSHFSLWVSPNKCLNLNAFILFKIFLPNQKIHFPSYRAPFYH